MEQHLMGSTKSLAKDLRILSFALQYILWDSRLRQAIKRNSRFSTFWKMKLKLPLSSSAKTVYAQNIVTEVNTLQLPMEM